MISGSDIGKIIYDVCREYGVETFIKGSIPIKDVDGERITISVGQIHDGRLWRSCYVNVNWYVPDVMSEGNAVRLEDIEVLMRPLHEGCGRAGGIQYRWRCETTEVAPDESLRCHYVNLKLLFETLKVLE